MLYVSYNYLWHVDIDGKAELPKMPNTAEGVGACFGVLSEMSGFICAILLSQWDNNILHAKGSFGWRDGKTGWQAEGGGRHLGNTVVAAALSRGLDLPNLCVTKVCTEASLTAKIRIYGGQVVYE